MIRAKKILFGIISFCIVGCGFWKQESKNVETALGDLASCVITHRVTDVNPTYEGISGECENVAVTDVTKIVDTYDANSGVALQAVDGGVAITVPIKLKKVIHKS